MALHTPSRLERALIIAVMLAAFRAVARAEEPRADDPKAEAARCFDRALELAERGAVSAALAEFQRAYDLQRHPAVLYNIGSSYAKLGRPIEAVDALGQYLAESGGAIDAGRRAAVEAEIVRQRARIGSLALTTTPPGARVRVDGVPVGTTPLDRVLSLAAGSHLVDAALDGHQRAERAILLGGGERLDLDLALVADTAAPAMLAIDCEVPDVAIRVDGHPLGQTPLSRPIQVPAGALRLEFLRAGYQRTERTVSAPSSGIARVACGIRPASPIPRAVLTTAILHVAETDAEIRVDGQEVEAGSVALPAGPHHLAVQRAGFQPWSRDLTLRAGIAETIEVALTPTLRYASEYEQRARARRVWAYRVGVAGLSAAVATAALWVWNDGRYSAWKTGWNELSSQGATCPESCPRQDALDRQIQSVQLVDKITVGLGVAAVAVLSASVALFVTGDDPDRYRQRAESQAFGHASSAESGW